MCWRLFECLVIAFHHCYYVIDNLRFWWQFTPWFHSRRLPPPPITIPITRVLIMPFVVIISMMLLCFEQLQSLLEIDEPILDVLSAVVTMI